MGYDSTPNVRLGGWQLQLLTWRPQTPLQARHERVHRIALRWRQCAGAELGQTTTQRGESTSRPRCKLPLMRQQRDHQSARSQLREAPRIPTAALHARHRHDAGTAGVSSSGQGGRRGRRRRRSNGRRPHRRRGDGPGPGGGGGVGVAFEFQRRLHRRVHALQVGDRRLEQQLRAAPAALTRRLL